MTQNKDNLEQKFPIKSKICDVPLAEARPAAAPGYIWWFTIALTPYRQLPERLLPLGIYGGAL